MLKIQTQMKHCIGKKIELIPNTKSNTFEKKDSCRLCGKNFEIEVETKIPNIKDHCHLTGKFRGLAQNKCKLNTQKKNVLFLPILCHGLMDTTVI